MPVIRLGKVGVRRLSDQEGTSR